jgi:hypothetical protein
MKHSNDYYRSLQRARKKWKPRKNWSFHHFTYKALGREVYRVHGMNLPGWLHVGVIHCLLGGGKRVSTQRFGKFPNLAQRIAHWGCRFLVW